MFHGALKSKAMELGAEFVKGEVKSLSEIKAKTIISAAGCWTKELLEDIPVEPQKHTVFRGKCPKHIPEMPLTGDLTTGVYWSCLLYTSPSPRDGLLARMPSSA